MGRVVLLSKLEETIIVGDKRYDLSVNQYPGVTHPKGHQYLKSFRLDPFPIFVYEVEGIEIEKSVFMVNGENTTVVQYSVRFLDPWTRLSSPEPKGAPGRNAVRVVLELRPLIAFRDYHSLAHQNPSIDPALHLEDRLTIIRPYAGMPALHLSHNSDEVVATGHWYREFEYELERERGLDYREDLFNPMALRFDLSDSGVADVIASIEPNQAHQAAQYRVNEIARRELIEQASPSNNPLARSLVRAADQYIVNRGDRKSVIAGYHWFGDWGRDTMISLPGLTLVTGRADVARGILSEFARNIDRGMLPNRFPDQGEALEYNTVDATLWFFEAIRAYAAYTGDYAFIQTELYPALRDVLDWHIRGTRYGIRMDSDGLLVSGADGVQLTWMDAKVGDHVVTPRRGKAVEIQALWFNALRVMEDLANRFEDRTTGQGCSQLAERCAESFNRLFWNEQAGCLYDVVDGDNRDASVRPNQILAVSLPHTMLSDDGARRVVMTVERHLMTPYGLRSLAPTDPKYIGHYHGGVWERDGAYHQGTVWAWLMGPFITAYMKANRATQESARTARSRAAEWLEYFNQHSEEACLGHVSEIFDGDSPHTPRGCVAQAWSTAELLRAACEDIFNVQPASRVSGIELESVTQPRRGGPSAGP
jgi:predicted glycogen debranching enzyme